jgi:hypothetical protein
MSNQPETVSKLAAAERLLDAAIHMLLDKGDHLAAIVLAGAAEDLLQGQLARGNRTHAASRVQLAKGTQAVHRHFFPDEEPLKDKDAFELMRDVYNWLRHDDRGDAVERRLDWRREALHICMRAVDNLFEVTGKVHPRVQELGYPVGNA